MHDALRSAGDGVQTSDVDAPEVVDRKLSLIVAHLRRDELARLRSFYAHSANCERRRSRTRAASVSDGASVTDVPRSSAPASPDAMDPRDYLGRC